MQAIFAKILNMSLTGSIVIAVVLLARLCLKRQPKIYSYALWAVVLFRLLCPLSITAGLSVLKPIPVTTTPGISSVSYQPVQQAVSYSRAVAQAQQEQSAVQEAEEPKRAASPMEIAAYVWLGGASIMALYSVAQYLALRRRLAEAMPYQEEVYLADSIVSPFVIGVFRPKIYLPSGTPEEERRFILAHERNHIRRGDHIWKLLGYAALCLHWFNPLVWLAFCLAGKDMEMSCDEAVIRQLGENVRADYSQALLRLATHKKAIAGMPLAFGEGDTKSRVRNMARWKKPKVWVSALCVIVCIVIAAACALNPKQSETSSEELRQTVGLAIINICDLRFKIPEGCIIEIRDKETDKQTDDGLDVSYWVFLDEETAVGGVNTFRIPDNYSEDNWDWLHALDLPEWKDETVGYFASGAPGNLVTVEFFSDVPDGQERTVLNEHNLYFYEDWIQDNMVYDVWFDFRLTNEKTTDTVLKALTRSNEMLISLPYVIGTLPNGITSETASDGSVTFCKSTGAVGGLSGYPIPDGVWEF